MTEPYRNRPCVAPSADVDKVVELIKSQRTRKGKMYPSERQFLTIVKKMLKLHINERLALVPVEGKKRSVIPFDDEALAKRFKCSPRQVKSAREKLAKLGVLFIPANPLTEKKKRQFGPGTFACWQLAYEYMIDEDFLLKKNPNADTTKPAVERMADKELERSSQAKRKSWGQLYDPFLVEKLERHTRDLIEIFAEDSEDGTVDTKSVYFCRARWLAVCGELMEDGLRVDNFRL